MKRQFHLFGLGLLLSLFTFSAMAADSPIVMLQTVSNQMLAELKSDKISLKTSPNKVFAIADRLLLPHADMTAMSRTVIGRDAWTNATPEQQQAFIKEFTQLLIRTYAAALGSYSDQTIKFYPIRGGWQNQQQVDVQSEILQPGEGPAIPVSYRLILKGQEWKVIDMSADNVSIVENYRAQFASDLSRGGLTALNTKLAQHNAQLAQKS